MSQFSLSRRSFLVGSGAAAAVGAVGTITPRAAASVPGFARRGYVLQQVSSVNNLLSYVPQFANVLNTVPAIDGLGIRCGWNVYDANPSLLSVGYGIAGGFAHYSARIMCGRHTPPSKMGRTITSGSTTFPSPFGGVRGRPNTRFLDEYETTMRQWAAFLSTLPGPEPILHWSWYAKEWAELYHGPEVRAEPGYTQDRFVAAHNALIDRAAEVQADYPNVIMEIPMSGHGPLQTITDDMTRHAGEVFGDGRSAIQANGWSYRGQWGQALDSVDAAMDAAFTEAWANQIMIGVQAIQPWGQNQAQYTATQVGQAFAQADLARADYFEIYTPSLLSSRGGQVWTEPVATWLAA
jgi:hypothetical protein